MNLLRLRGKDISPCRLLFSMKQRAGCSFYALFGWRAFANTLIIAAPENISPEKGTTYKLVRKVFQNTEHVHVVGLRELRAPETLPGTDEAPSQAS